MYKTMEQIKQEYDGHWVFLINCKKGEYHAIAGGEVALFGSKSEVFRDMGQYWNGHGNTLVFYAGKVPEGAHFLL